MNSIHALLVGRCSVFCASLREQLTLLVRTATWESTSVRGSTDSQSHRRNKFVEATDTVEEARRTARWFAVAVAFACVVWAWALIFWFDIWTTRRPNERAFVSILMALVWILWLAITDSNWFPVRFQAAFTSPRAMANSQCSFVLFMVVASHINTYMETNLLAVLSLIPLIAGSLKGGLTVVVWIAIAACTHVLLTVIRLSGEPTRTLSGSEVRAINVGVEVLLTFLSAWLVYRIQARLDEFREAQSLWATMLSRDIRTPLHGLLGSAEQLQNLDDVDAAMENRDAFDTIQGCARMIMAILDNLLGTTSSAPTSEFDNFITIDDMERELMRISRAISGRRACTVSVANSIPVELAVLNVEASVVIEIMGNIVSNAVKFSPEASVIDIVLTLCADNVKAGSVNQLPDGFIPCVFEIAVEDAGPGVSRNLREIIFAPFERGSATGGKRQTDGIGLGLSIVRDTVTSKLNGVVRCEDRRDGSAGARFVVSFPSAVGPHSSSVTGAVRGPLSASASSRFAHMHVLIVDDNNLNVRVLRRFLVRAGVTEDCITDVASAESALETVRSTRGKFDLAFLDLVLPGMDGIQLASKLCQDPARCPRTMIGASASLTPDVQERWRATGVTRQISKPFSANTIASCLSELDCQSPFAFSNFAQQVNRNTLSDVSAVVPHTLLDAQRKQLAMTVINTYIILRIGTLLVGGARLKLALQMAILVMFTLMSKRWFSHTSVRGLQIMFLVSFFFAFLRPIFFGLNHYVGFIGWPVIVGFVFGERDIGIFLGAYSITTFGLIMAHQRGFVPICFDETTPLQNEIQSLFTFSMVALSLLNYLALTVLADDARIRWANTLSHDLRAPLHGISAAVGDFEETGCKFHDEAKEAVRTMHACTVSLLGITDTVLSLALPEQSRASDLLNLRQYVNTVVDTSKTVIPADAIEVDPDTVKLHGNVSLPVHFLIYASTQLVSYLSIFCTKSSRVRLSVTIAPDPTSSSGLLLEFRLAETVAQEFTPDMRRLTRPWLGELGGGSTLLRVARQLHGYVGNVVNDDCTWQIWIVVPCEEILDSRGKIPTDCAQNIRDLHVLIVDDNVFNLKVLKKMLARLDVQQVLTLTSPIEALDRVVADGCNYDIIFVDVRMPAMDGRVFAKHVRQNLHGQLRRPLMIGCTASADPETASSCREAGMDAVLTKPFSVARLYDVLREIVCNVARQDEGVLQ